MRTCVHRVRNLIKERYFFFQATSQSFLYTLLVNSNLSSHKMRF